MAAHKVLALFAATRSQRGGRPTGQPAAAKRLTTPCDQCPRLRPGLDLRDGTRALSGLSLFERGSLRHERACRGVMLGTDCLARIRRAPPRLVAARHGRGSAWAAVLDVAQGYVSGSGPLANVALPIRVGPGPGLAGCGPAERRAPKC
jgi:hypothetical protein